MHKYEVGKSRPTENKATNLITNEAVSVWLQKVRNAGKFVDGDGVNAGLDRVAKVLVELIQEIKAGRVDREVISELTRRQNIGASLMIAQHILEKGVKNGSGTGSKRSG